MFCVVLLALMCLTVSAEITSTCHVNVTEQQSFSILTCVFSSPVVDFIVEFKPSSGQNAESMQCFMKGNCSGREELKDKYVFIGAEKNDQQVSIGVVTGTDRAAGSYKCIPLSTFSPVPEVHDCKLTASKKPAGSPLLSSSCTTVDETGQGAEVSVTCSFSETIRYFQVEQLTEPNSLPEPAAICTPAGCTTGSSHFRVVSVDPNLRQIVLATNNLLVAKRGRFRCKPFVQKYAYQDKLCPTIRNTPTTEATLVTTSCTVQAAEDSTALVLTCVFSHETEEFQVELYLNSSSRNSSSPAVCTRYNCTSHGGFSYTPVPTGDKLQAKVRIAPPEGVASRAEYKCLPVIPANHRLVAAGCRANFEQFTQTSAASITAETHTTENSHGKNSYMFTNSNDKSDAAYYVIITGCFVGVSAMVVAVALVVVIRMWRTRVSGLPSQGRTDVVTYSGLSALLARSSVQVSENLYEEIPKDLVGSAELIERTNAKDRNLHDTTTQTSTTRLDLPAHGSRSSVLDLSDACEVKALDLPGRWSYLTSGLQKKFHRRASEPSIGSSTRRDAQSGNDNSSLNSLSRSPSQKSSFSTSDSSAVYLHAVSESSIALDLDPKPLERQRALLQVMDCSHVDLSDDEAPPKPCGSRVDRLLKQLRASQEDGLNK